MSLFIVGQFFGPWRGKSFQTIITGYRTVEGTRIREKRYLNVEVDVRSNGTMMKRLGRSEIIPKRRVRMILVPLHQLSQREKLQRIESISLSLFYPLASLLSSFSRLCILSFFFLCFLLEWKINNLKALKVEVFNGDRADWFVWFFLATEIDVFDSFFVDRVTFNWIILSKNGRLKYEVGIVILNFRCFDRSHEYFQS